MKTLIVNFGGPRNIGEIEPFLIELLCDRDVIRSPFPKIIHNYFFTRLAKKRALKIRHDYELIGGKSPIFEDTEALAAELNALAFHRYLPSTHPEFLKKITQEEMTVFPMFPQFSFATTGSIARWFSKKLPKSNLKWIKSYHDHPLYIQACVDTLKNFLQSQNLKEEECLLLFSAHGLPQTFIDTGDPYQSECETSFRKITKVFNTDSLLCYQSQFGRDEWIRPYTLDICKNPPKTKKNIVFFPLSFTTDHIETLFEIEYQYLPLLRTHNLNAYRCPAIHHNLNIATIIEQSQTHPIKDLIYS